MLPVHHLIAGLAIVIVILCLLLLHQHGFGELVGAAGASFVDCVYFSAAVFTTVGLGDIYPIGAIRVMTGTEGIVGLTMITWSASYTFVEMHKTWGKGG